jgi:DamX protein
MKVVTLIRLAVLMFIPGLSQSQDLPQQETENNSDEKRTQVVCYAAEDRWVCAPKGSEKPTEAIEQAKAQADIEQQSTPEITESVTEPTPVNPMDPPAGVESLTDTAPAQPVTNPMAETPEDVLTEQSPQATVPPQQDMPDDINESEVQQQSVSADYAGDNWFERYPDHWTIQIIGVANRQNLNAFIQQQQLTDANHRIVETRVNDAPWWVVIYGHYPDRDAADEARSRLPERLATDAWLRPLSSLTGD